MEYKILLPKMDSGEALLTLKGLSLVTKKSLFISQDVTLNVLTKSNCMFAVETRVHALLSMLLLLSCIWLGEEGNHLCITFALG